MVVRKCKVVGVRPVSYTRKSTGELVEGIEIYLTYNDSKIEGIGCGMAFLRKGTGKDEFKPGEDGKFYHDEFRRIFAYIPE